MRNFIEAIAAGLSFLVRGATLETDHQLTMLELANQTEPDGSQAKIAEILTKELPALMDAPWQEANGTTFHQITRRYSIPKGEKRALNAGVGKGSSRTITAHENMAMIEQYSEPDVKLVKMAPNPAAFRMNQAKAFIEGISQTLGDLLFYGNQLTNPLDYTGLAPRLASLGYYVLSAGGSGADLTSIYVVQWGEDTTYMIYPKGVPHTGIVQHDDLGEQTILDSDSKQYQAYRDHFHTDAGLAVEDPRSIGRIANIEDRATGSNGFDDDLLIELLNRMPKEGRGATIYVNTDVKTQMDIMLKDKTNVNYTRENGWGGEILNFRGHPVRKMDSILDTESAVS